MRDAAPRGGARGAHVARPGARAFHGVGVRGRRAVRARVPRRAREARSGAAARRPHRAERQLARGRRAPRGASRRRVSSSTSTRPRRGRSTSTSTRSPSGLVSRRTSISMSATCSSAPASPGEGAAWYPLGEAGDGSVGRLAAKAAVYRTRALRRGRAPRRPPRLTGRPRPVVVGGRSWSPFLRQSLRPGAWRWHSRRCSRFVRSGVTAARGASPSPISRSCPGRALLAYGIADTNLALIIPNRLRGVASRWRSLVESRSATVSTCHVRKSEPSRLGCAYVRRHEPTRFRRRVASTNLVLDTMVLPEQLVAGFSRALRRRAGGVL